MNNDTEQQIAALLSRKETHREAFALIVREYGERLYWKIRRLVLRHEDADDVLQNTFLKAWASLPTFQNKSKISTWLFSIAIRESIDFLRKQSRQRLQEGDFNAADTLPADGFFDGDAAQLLLKQAICTLPEAQRAVFTMRYFDEMKYSELSQVLSTSEGALKASYHIAVKKITEYIKERQ